MTGKRALVLGGGGVAGIAWETGLLAGLASAGADVTDADLLVGTSAGSAVAAQLGSGLSLTELFARQADPELQSEELAPPMSIDALMDTMMGLVAGVTHEGELRRKVGGMALAAETVPEPVRREVVAARLPAHAWPDRELAIVVVDANTGEPRVLTRESGVDLVDAVAASCAVPGIWPPVTIGGSRYIDGGVRSVANADLAATHERVLILAPMIDPTIDEQVGRLRATTEVELVTLDEESTAAFGIDPLDQAVRTPTANAGRAQGVRIAPAVAEFWHG